MLIIGLGWGHLLLPSYRITRSTQQLSRPPDPIWCLGLESRRWRVSDCRAAHRLVLLMVCSVGLEELLLAGRASDGVNELSGRSQSLCRAHFDNGSAAMAYVIVVKRASLLVSGRFAVPGV